MQELDKQTELLLDVAKRATDEPPGSRQLTEALGRVEARAAEIAEKVPASGCRLSAVGC